jgi:hypothetical protein
MDSLKRVGSVSTARDILIPFARPSAISFSRILSISFGISLESRALLEGRSRSTTAIFSRVTLLIIVVANMCEVHFRPHLASLSLVAIAAGYIYMLIKKRGDDKPALHL